jgi:MFS family permease
MAASALVVHMVPMLKDAGLDAARAARVASIIGIGIILGRLLIGWIIDRLFAPHVAAAIFAIAALGCVLLAQGGAEEAPVAAFLIGFALGAEVDLMAYLTSRYFGLRHYGFLYGTVYACFWIGIATGPALAGRLYDATGGYAIALWSIVALFAIGSVAALTMPRFAAAAGERPT